MKPIVRYLTALLAIANIASAVAKDWGRPDLEGDEFEKRFTASYGILSEKEPPLTELEIQILEKMAPMMRVNPDYAQTMLEGMTVGDKPTSATFYYLLGNIYFENGDYFLAEAQYKQAIEKFPDFQRAWTNLGVLRLRSNDTRNALLALLRAIALGDVSPHTFGMLGYCHYKEGNYISAEVAYDRAMLSEPENLDWLEGKAQVYLEAERYIEAIRMQDELILRHPNDAEYWLAQTNAYLVLDDYERATRNLEIVRSLGKADFQSLYLLGSLYAKLGMNRPASDAYLAAVPLAKTSDIGSLLEAVRVILQGGQFDQARQLFDKIQADPATLDAKARFSYLVAAARFAEMEGDTATVIKLLSEATDLQPTNGVLLVKLARLHAAEDQRGLAYLLLDRAENDPEAEYLAVITRAQLLIEEKRFAESQRYVSRALKLRSTETVEDLYQQVEQAAKQRS